MDIRDLAGAPRRTLSRHLYKLMINRKQSQASDETTTAGTASDPPVTTAMPNDIVKPRDNIQGFIFVTYRVMAAAPDRSFFQPTV